MNKKVIVGLSGGVDSVAALILLKKQGWQPVGVNLTLPVWKKKLKRKKNNWEIAKNICQKLKIPFYRIDSRRNFKEKIVDYYLKELRNNRTPNPCVICNAKFKFKQLLDFADANHVNFIATGHYAVIKKTQLPFVSFQLLKAKDKVKDQSYYLSFLSQRILKRTIFPLGGYLKETVYQIVRKEGFDYWDKKNQSQDFCYLAGSSPVEFIKKEIKMQPGFIVDERGKVVGKHQGLSLYTIGQRKGIKLSGGPFFVKSFNVKKNLLIITKNKNQICHKKLLLKPYNLISNLISQERKVNQLNVMAKVRYCQPLKPAILNIVDNQAVIIFNKPQTAVSPGQVCVFYRQNQCLGGGVINKLIQ